MVSKGPVKEDLGRDLGNGEGDPGRDAGIWEVTSRHLGAVGVGWGRGG